jgi:hypothetical protein
MKKVAFTSLLERSGNRLWSCHFRVPRGIVHHLVGADSRRVICTLNASVKYQCAILPQGNGIFVITVNKKIQHSLGLAFGMQVHVCLEKDISRYGLPMPEELEELLRQDPEGRVLFHALTRGRQRTLLHIVGAVTNSDVRVARATAVIRHLRSNNGKINYRLLYTALRHQGARSR